MSEDVDDEWIASVLDGEPILVGVGRKCVQCDRWYEPGDDLVVNLDRKENTDKWQGPYGGCPDCQRRTLRSRRIEQSFDQVIVEIPIKETPNGLVFDGSQLTVLDRSPAGEGER